MNTKKKNTVQLIVAGIALVFVAIGGTFAWFASSSASRVDLIGATVASPSIESGFGEIQIYDPTLMDWVEYDGEDPLSFVPGQSYSFRVTFYANEEQSIWLRLNDLTDSGGDEQAKLYNALDYRVKNAANPDAEFSPLKNVITESEGKLSAEIISTRQANTFEQQNQKYICYYDLMLNGDAGNEYFDKQFNATVELIIS